MSDLETVVMPAHLQRQSRYSCPQNWCCHVNMMSINLASLILAVSVCVFHVAAPSRRTVDERSETNWRRSDWIFQLVDARPLPSPSSHRLSKVSCIHFTLLFSVPVGIHSASFSIRLLVKVAIFLTKLLFRMVQNVHSKRKMLKA